MKLNRLPERGAQNNTIMALKDDLKNYMKSLTPAHRMPWRSMLRSLTK